VTLALEFKKAHSYVARSLEIFIPHRLVPQERDEPNSPTLSQTKTVATACQIFLIYILYIHIYVLYYFTKGEAMTNNVIKSADRVFGVLELFRDQQAPLTATEICKYLDYPKSSADALLKSLVSLGYLSLDSSSMRYFPSRRLTQLGDWLPRLLLGEGDTLSMLDELHETTGETITLSMPNGLAMQFISAIPGTFPISLNIREGQTIPIFATAVGIAQLGTRSDGDVEKLVKRANRLAARSDERVDIRALKQEIESARSDGYVEAYDRVLTDTGAIAMALPRSQLDRTLVVAVGGLSERIKANRVQIIQKMRKSIWQLGHNEAS